MPESLAYALCAICEIEILPFADPEQDAMRYCYKGEHWVKPVCVKCGESATGVNIEGEGVCARHVEAGMAVAV